MNFNKCLYKRKAEEQHFASESTIQNAARISFVAGSSHAFAAINVETFDEYICVVAEHKSWIKYLFAARLQHKAMIKSKRPFRWRRNYIQNEMRINSLILPSQCLMWKLHKSALAVQPLAFVLYFIWLDFVLTFMLLHSRQLQMQYCVLYLFCNEKFAARKEERSQLLFLMNPYINSIHLVLFAATVHSHVIESCSLMH